MIQRYLLLWLTLLSVLALLWPTVIAAPLAAAWSLDDPGRLDPFAGTRRFIPHLFAATMFVIGCLLPRDEVAAVARQWSRVLAGTGLQYAAMPLLAFTVAQVLPLEDDVRTGVVLVGCVPGAMASNVLTLLARGNVTYSVSLTTSATLLSPLIVPLTLYLAVRVDSVDRMQMASDAFWLLVVQVVGPVVLGHLVARHFQSFQAWMHRHGAALANLSILWIIAVVVNANHTRLLEAGPQIIGALLIVNVLGYCAGFGGGTLLRLPPGMRRALTLEVGMQNAGLGASMAQQLFAERNLIALPPALYTFGCMLTGSLLALYWSRSERRLPAPPQPQESSRS
jgi:BASS family bile acid:Na+ symporter